MTIRIIEAEVEEEVEEDFMIETFNKEDKEEFMLINKLVNYMKIKNKLNFKLLKKNKVIFIVIINFKRKNECFTIIKTIKFCNFIFYFFIKFIIVFIIMSVHIFFL